MALFNAWCACGNRECFRYVELFHVCFLHAFFVDKAFTPCNDIYFAWKLTWPWKITILTHRRYMFSKWVGFSRDRKFVRKLRGWTHRFFGCSALLQRGRAHWLPCGRLNSLEGPARSVSMATRRLPGEKPWNAWGLLRGGVGSKAKMIPKWTWEDEIWGSIFFKII